MKHFILILTILSFNLYGQTPVNDTSWVETKVVERTVEETNEAGLDTSYTVIDTVFFLVQKVEYSDNSYSQRSSYIGTANVVYIQALQKMEMVASQTARNVVQLTSVQREITNAVQENNGIIAITGQSPLDSLTIRVADYLTNQSFVYQIVNGENVIPVSFMLNSIGKLRYTLEGQSARAVWGFDKWVLRLVNYNGQPLDLFWDESKNRYVSQDGKTFLRRVKP